MKRLSVLERAAITVDSAVLSLVHHIPGDGPTSAAKRIERDTALLLSEEHKRCVESLEWTFPVPSAVEVEKRWLLPHRVGFQEWTWKSEPPLAFPAIERAYRAHPENSRAVMRTVDLRMKGRPMAIIVNGFSSGHHIVERLTWPIREFHRQGIGVSLLALPFHGPRAHTFPPKWPGDDHRHVIEGFRQAIWDLRVAMRALRDAGASHVGVVGMSLGGLTTALLATIAEDLDFAIPYVPIDSISNFIQSNELYQGATTAENDVLHTLNEKLLAPVTPAQRAPAIAADRIHIISGTCDQFAPIEHGRRLAEHFGCEHITFDGAHLLQRHRTPAFRQALQKTGTGSRF